MIHSDARALRDRGDRLFTEKRPLDLRNQDLADHFYPERADFIASRSLGADFASHMMTGYPSMVRRQLGDSLGSMLRPRAKQWFHVRAADDRREGHASRKWLEWATGVQRRAMYDRITGFARATKEADHDFATFGSPVLSVEANRRDTALLYRAWHPRDVAWAEDAYGQIGEVHRSWKPTAAQVCSLYRDPHPKCVKRAKEDPHATVLVRHVVIRTDDYAASKRFRTPWVSLALDCENDHILEEVGSWTRRYVIPRWATVSGSQYAHSPATVIALPDARLLQAMTLTLLEAGEKAVNPPLVGVKEAMPGGVQTFAGGFTAVDADYDERLGEVLRPISQDTRSLPFGLEMADRTAGMLREAFFLNAIGLPPRGGPEMTAFEVGQRVQEYIRNALPLFEPMEHEYNGELCEMTFETLMREGTFGPADDIPAELRGGDVRFVFDNPLSEMLGREKGQLFLESRALIAAAVEAEPSAARIMDFSAALRDTLEGIGVPTKWTRSADDVAAAEQATKAEQGSAALLAEMQAGADVAATLGGAAQSFAAADAA